MPYPQPGGRGKGIIFLFLFLVVALIIFVIWGDRFSFTQKLHYRIFKEGISDLRAPAKAETVNVIMPPESVHEWCRIQEITVDNDREAPKRDRILGWDAEKKCCVREVSGYNCALHKDSILKYCYSSLIGGTMKWVMIDGYYVDDYKLFLDHLDKELIQNKPCSTEKYPSVLVGG